MFDEKKERWGKKFLRLGTAAWVALFFLGAGFRVLADCSSFGLPFTDLGSVSGFCAAIAEAYYTGITNGTSATTFSPNANVTRAQAAALATRTLDASLYRGSRRAALGQWWTSTPHFDQGLGLVSVGNNPQVLRSDGSDVWVPNLADGTVTRIRASDGALLGTWTGAELPRALIPAMGKVFVVGGNATGALYLIDPMQAPGAMTAIATIGAAPTDVAFDGENLWSANFGAHSVSIIVPGSWAVTSQSLGTVQPTGLLYDGHHMWVTAYNAATLAGSILRLASDGSVMQTVPVGEAPGYPAFDGANLWVPNRPEDSVSVVRAIDGAVHKTFSAANGNQNGLSEPEMAAFDGQRVLVTDNNGGVSLFRSTDLSPLGFFPTPGVTSPFGVCNDGISFWISFFGSAAIGRF